MSERMTAIVVVSMLVLIFCNFLADISPWLEYDANDLIYGFGGVIVSGTVVVGKGKSGGRDG